MTRSTKENYRSSETQSEGGKGSRRRSTAVSSLTYTSNWDAVFAKEVAEEENIVEKVCHCGTATAYPLRTCKC